jgi:hypothetical protein
MAEIQPQPPIKLAFVIDGEVVEVISAPDRLAAIMMSQPEVIDVTHLADQNGHNPGLLGKHYDSATGTFSDPA